MHSIVKFEAFIDECAIIVIEEKTPESISEACVDLPLHLGVNLWVPDVESNGFPYVIGEDCWVATSWVILFQIIKERWVLTGCDCNKTKKDEQVGKLLGDVFHFNYNN